MGTINSLLDQIGPGQSEINQASTSPNYIRQLLEKKSQTGEMPRFAYSFLTGSYKRGTKITPLDDADVFIVLNAKGCRLSDSNTIWVEEDSIYGSYKND